MQEHGRFLKVYRMSRCRFDGRTYLSRIETPSNGGRENVKEKQRSNFSDFLSTESTSDFWITGKAGSGKSCLMKHLSHHGLVKDALQAWAGNQDLVQASFFFWIAGSEFQKSQMGLLRSLLHEMIRQSPDLIALAFPDLVRKDPYAVLLENEPWSIQRLYEVFDRISTMSLPEKKFFLLIDGLDEYEGDPVELIKLIHRLSSQPNIKMCISSRPWNVFMEQFGQDSTRTLMLQDYTRDDIRLYIQENLEQDPRL